MNNERNKPLVLGEGQTVATELLEPEGKTLLLHERRGEEGTLLLNDGAEQIPASQQTHTRELYQMPEGAVLSDRYVIGDILGYGGFGITYSAWDRKLEMRVAIKEYYPSTLVNRIPGSNRVEVFSEKRREEYEKGLNRFLGEAQNMARFSGKKNIVSVYNYFSENGTAYLVMEYLDGVSLKEYTKMHGGKLPYEEVIEITKSLLAALKILHKHHIIHRDISPDNIFMCKDGTVKLIDFGAARFSTERDEDKTLSIILKPGFAPPEQYLSKGKQGPWTDIYALGASMYRTVTGVIPEESVNRLVEDTLANPREYVPEIPKYFNNILMKSMALQEQLRFQSVEDLERKLRRKKKVSSVKGELLRRKVLRFAIPVLLIGAIAWFGIKEYEYIQAERNKATLENCTIVAWVPTQEDEKAEERVAQFAEALADFTTTYPMVTLQIEAVPESEYAQRLEEAVKNNTLPTVFDVDYLPREYDSSLASLEDTYERLDKNLCSFWGLLKSTPRYDKALPTSFDVPLVFTNTSVKSASLEGNDLTAFLEEKNPYYVGSFDDYEMIQAELPGKYEVSLPESERQQIKMTNVWAVSNRGTTAQENAGVRLLYYMMSEQAQDILYVQGDDGFPMHAELLTVYISINPEMSILADIPVASSMQTYLTEDDFNRIYETLGEK